MQAPIRTTEEVESNAAFEALLRAIAEPGPAIGMPDAGFTPIIAALIDRECVVYATDPMIVSQLIQTGARISYPEVAEFVFCHADEATDIAPRLTLGSDYYPDDGATIVIETRLGAGCKLKLTGPGIETDKTVQVGGLGDAFWNIRQGRARYPMGFDIILVDGQNVVAIPRSTQVEVI